MFGANNKEAEKELDRTCCTREQFVKADDRGKNDMTETKREAKDGYDWQFEGRQLCRNEKNG
jgi:hypothetical protein